MWFQESIKRTEYNAFAFRRDFGPARGIVMYVYSYMCDGFKCLSLSVSLLAGPMKLPEVPVHVISTTHH
jgi:hypothetical protein